MKTNIHLTAFFILLICCTSLIAQRKIFKGYYISVLGDTVRGEYPGYTQWSRNPTTVKFKSENSNMFIQITPSNAVKFEVDGYDEYLSYKGTRLVNPMADDELFNNKSFYSSADSSEQVSSFLRLVSRTPECELYVLIDSKRTNFFYMLPGEEMVELIYKKSLAQNRIIEHDEYKQQLSILFKDIIIQKNLSASLVKLQYREDDLKAFFQSMFQVTKKEGRKKGNTAEWIISAGIGLNFITEKNNSGSNPTSQNYKASFSPVLSFGFIQPIDRQFGKYFIYPKLKIFYYKNTNEENQGTFIKAVTYQSAIVATAEISGGINLINRDKFRFFFTGGVGPLLQIKGKNTEQLYSSTDHTPYGNAVITQLPFLTYFITTSSGITINRKISISASYMLPAPISKFMYIEDTKLSGMNLSIAYKLR